MDNSLIRSRALPTFCRNPSWVWLKEMALPTLLIAAELRLMPAVNRIETAKPAASSSGETIFEPDERRARDLASMLEDSESKRALLKAEMFVLITITASVSGPKEGPLSKR